MTDVSYKKGGDIPPFAVDKLVSPYIKSYLGPVKVVGADLKCVRRPDGTYRYTYTLTAEPAPPTGEKTSSSKTSSSLSTALPSAARSSSFTTATDGLSVYSQRSAIFLKDVDFVLIFEGADGKEQREQFSAEFEASTTLQKMIHQFRQEASRFVVGGLFDFRPRLAVKVGNKSVPVDKELCHKTLKEIMASVVDDTVSGGFRRFTIFADVRKR